MMIAAGSGGYKLRMEQVVRHVPGDEMKVTTKGTKITKKG